MSTTTLLTTPELAERWGVSVGHLQNLRAAGRGPAHVKLMGGSVRYRASDIEKMENDSVISTLDQVAA